MPYEWRELTDVETKQLADWGQRIMELERVEKGKIQTERVGYEVGWAEKIASINAEIAKNNDAIQAIRTATSVDGKTFTFTALTDVDAKNYSDYKQRNESLAVELAKIAANKKAMEVQWNDRIAAINNDIHIYSDNITYLREPVEK